LRTVRLCAGHPAATSLEMVLNNLEKLSLQPGIREAYKVLALVYLVGTRVFLDVYKAVRTYCSTHLISPLLEMSIK
jgi:hypothetical protein